FDVAAVVGVPEISPVPELIDRPAGRPVAPYVSVCPDAESVACICRLTAGPTVEGWLPGVVTVTMLPPPEPGGPVHNCWAEPVQVSMSSRAPVLAPGSVRHRPEFGLTSSPLAWWVQFCAAVPLHGYQSTLVPLVVPAAATSRQPPCTRSVLSV